MANGVKNYATTNNFLSTVAEWEFQWKSWGGALKIRRRKKLVHTYNDIISLENLCLAWEEFIIGKKRKADVIKFGGNLMDNIVELHTDLVNRSYCHGGYKSFYITDPKRRHIHKASVRDRLLHHAVYRVLYPFFDKTFIADSYSCRDDKGTHKALNKFNLFARKVSENNTRTCWVLKCDIRKFFASIDQKALIDILRENIPDQDIIRLLQNIVVSFYTENTIGVGLPLGNLTSQLLGNVYMNRFDQWVKHTLKVKYYIRYADDFVFFSQDKNYLESIIPRIQDFLQTKLKLSLHPDKLFLATSASGIDFLGWVHFPNHSVLRTKTKQRMFEKMRKLISNESFQSYYGLIRHGSAYKLRERMIMEKWFRQ